VVVILAVRFGFVTVAQLRAFRGYALLGAAVICAVITPPDALSMLILLACMMVLYELGIILAGFFTQPAASAAEAAAEAEKSA
jgi:sec-independent protein translocase protein TatC